MLQRVQEARAEKPAKPESEKLRADCGEATEETEAEQEDRSNEVSATCARNLEKGKQDWMNTQSEAEAKKARKTSMIWFQELQKVKRISN